MNTTDALFTQRESLLVFSGYVLPATLELKEENMLTGRGGDSPPPPPCVSTYVMLYNMM